MHIIHNRLSKVLKFLKLRRGEKFSKIDLFLFLFVSFDSAHPLYAGCIGFGGFHQINTA